MKFINIGIGVCGNESMKIIEEPYNDFIEWMFKKGVIMCYSDVNHLWYEFDGETGNPLTLQGVYNRYWEDKMAV